MSKWINVDAGPIQVKRIKKAIGEVQWEGRTFTQITGVVGQKESRHTITNVFGPIRPEVQEIVTKVAESFDWTITKKNAVAIVKAYAEALEEAKKSRPEEDERITPDESAERSERMREQAERMNAESERYAAMREQVKAKAPAGAQAVIVAELKEDKSDPMTDYFANHTVRAVAIGFRFSKREDFKALRAAAATFDETKGLGPDAPKDIEHRDNYSMGKGNYLSDHGWDGSGSGWVIKSYPLDNNYMHIDEIAIPERTASSNGTVVSKDGYEIRPSSLGREGVVEIHFAEKPDEEVRGRLKSAGFRWARGNRCWYGREDRLADAGIKQ